MVILLSWSIVAVLVAMNDRDVRLLVPCGIGILQAVVGELSARRLSMRPPWLWTLSKWMLLSPLLTSLAAFLLFGSRGGAGCLAVMSGWGVGGAVYRWVAPAGNHSLDDAKL